MNERIYNYVIVARTDGMRYNVGYSVKAASLIEANMAVVSAIVNANYRERKVILQHSRLVSIRSIDHE